MQECQDHGQGGDHTHHGLELQFSPNLPPPQTTEKDWDLVREGEW